MDHSQSPLIAHRTSTTSCPKCGSLGLFRAGYCSCVARCDDLSCTSRAALLQRHLPGQHQMFTHHPSSPSCTSNNDSYRRSIRPLAHLPTFPSSCRRCTLCQRPPIHSRLRLGLCALRQLFRHALRFPGCDDDMPATLFVKAGKAAVAD